MTTPSEYRLGLWLILAAPTVWAAHFLLSYVTAAVWCAKLAGPEGSLDGARAAIAVYTLIAVAAIGVIAALGYRHRPKETTPVPEGDSDGPGIARFLGAATLLLCALSLLATLYAALVALLIEACR